MASILFQFSYDLSNMMRHVKIFLWFGGGRMFQQR
jgi:hypothetical protein